MRDGTRTVRFIKDGREVFFGDVSPFLETFSREWSAWRICIVKKQKEEIFAWLSKRRETAGARMERSQLLDYFRLRRRVISCDRSYAQFYRISR